MKLILFHILVLLTVSNTIYAQTPTDYCRVTSTTWSIPEKLGTGIFVLGEFRPTTFDDTTTKTFEHKDSNLTVVAEIEYSDFKAAEKGKPIEIQLTLNISNKESNLANLFDNTVVAKTSYGKRWGKISVSTPVKIGDLVYNFGFTCNDGSKIRKGFVLY